MVVSYAVLNILSAQSDTHLPHQGKQFPAYFVLLAWFHFSHIRVAGNHGFISLLF